MESLRIVIIFVKVFQLLDHLAEVLHQERGYHDSEEHDECAKNPLCIVFRMEVSKAHRRERGESIVSQTKDSLNVGGIVLLKIVFSEE